VWVCGLSWFSLGYISVANSCKNYKVPGFYQGLGIPWLAGQILTAE